MIDIDELKKLALAATPGPWVVQRPNAGNRGLEVAANNGLEQVAADLTQERASYIAAANPQTVIALIAELAALRQESYRKGASLAIASNAISYAESQASEWHCKAGTLENELRRAELDKAELRQELEDLKADVESRGRSIVAEHEEAERLRQELESANQAKRNLSGLLDKALEQNEGLKKDLEEARKDAAEARREAFHKAQTIVLQLSRHWPEELPWTDENKLIMNATLMNAADAIEQEKLKRQLFDMPVDAARQVDESANLHKNSVDENADLHKQAQKPVKTDLNGWQSEKAEKARTQLQKIKDDPQDDEERAFKRDVLDNMSDPRCWDDTTAVCALFGAQEWSKGWKAARQQTS